jgi:hypothetical protein
MKKKPHVIDYDSFLPRLIEALRKAWTEVRSKRPRDTFYQYGIGTDSDVVVMAPFCNAESLDESTQDCPLARWDIQEKLYGAGRKHTAALETEVNHYVFEDHSGESDSVFGKRKARLLQIFEQALVKLDKEGFFGTGKARQKVILKIDRGDCDEDEWHGMLEVIDRINPPESTAKFFALVNQAAEQQDKKKMNADAIGKRAADFMRQQQRSFLRYFPASIVGNEGIIPHLMKKLGLTEKPKELWMVTFEIKKVAPGKSDGTNVLSVIVDPETGQCAFS